MTTREPPVDPLIAQTLLAGVVAAILTFCDLDAVFDAPPSLEWGEWGKLQLWWWGFILVNGALAGALFVALCDKEAFRDLNRWFAAFLAGASYSALVRLKFTTLPNNTPVGIDTFYEALKGVVHRRINRIVQVWRGRESKKLAESSLEELRQQALILVGTNALLSEEQRNTDKLWINQIATDKKATEADRKLALAIFVITGQK